ncbi:hypothetical protein [Plantactinospora sp. KBS50]|uniref:hypothetical protein n=1 Tax=Plantactinospora sp. KBS50 TaxID=2024580 RepID=UPI000BAAECF6|nr:hypothetical protein [Plantactinospora sp. KBS50]ASW57934.1 hypothetical protein CIK06_22945 [Plantactinospora sp. KBS50]
MKPPFSRWLPAIAHTRTTLRRSAPGLFRVPALARSGRVARYASAATRTVPAMARYPVPRGAILAATGLTAAAALAGQPLAGAQSAAPEAARPAALTDAATAAPGGADAGNPGDRGAAAGVPVQPPADPAQPADGAAADDGAAAAGEDAAQPEAAPSLQALIPYGTQGPQSRVNLTSEQTDNARTIVRTARRMNLPDRAAVIGVATSLQESKLDNLGHLGAANDHDSLGLFQQRPSAGWGSPDQVTDPQYAAMAFFNGLRNVPDWQNLPLTDAAQRVQVSAFPFAYAQWEQQAADIVRDVWDR